MPAHAQAGHVIGMKNVRRMDAADVIVVGGRCAGAPVAMLLARAGLRVRLLERARQLGDVVSGHMIKPAGAARLREWGLLGELLDVPTPAIINTTLWVGGEPYPAPPLPADRTALAPRRCILDRLLLAAARDAGADVRLGVTVRSVLRAGERVTGVRTSAGDQHARLVIGADGRHSVIARAVGADWTWLRPTATYGYYTYWSGAQVDRMHAWLEPGLFAGLFPTNDGQALMFYQAPAAGFADARLAPDERYRRVLDDRPALRQHLARAEITEHIRGIGDLPTFFRRSAGPGWALIGDAGHHKDPLIARGIADAFRDAAVLAETVTRYWDSGLDEAVAAYERRRDRDARPLAEANLAIAALDQSGSVLAGRWRAAAALEQQLGT
jgi:flavin-dependent dehydrogenase